MDNIFENLKKYLESNSRSKVLEDWSRTENSDKIGPTIDEFLATTNWYFKIKTNDPIVEPNTLNCDYSLKFSSGFFIINKYKLCNKQLFQ